jgi:NAD(P)H-hydrate epimerase
MQEIDRLMVDSYGISLTQMMENAGCNLALLAKKFLGGSVVDKKICIVVGGGNKGGAGLVSARHLSNWGAEVTCLATKPPATFKRIAARQLEIVRHLPISVVSGEAHLQYIEWERNSLIIDAMIGYGLQGEPDAATSKIINQINQSPGRVISLDTPSGLHACNGFICDSVVKADATLTLALPKQGLLKSEAQYYVGEIYLGDISVPPLLYRQIGLHVNQSIFKEDTIIPYPGK